MVICLERDADLHMAQLMPCHSLSLASVKSRLVLPLWYRFTRVVPEKGPLNVCVCVCTSSLTPQDEQSFYLSVWFSLTVYLNLATNADCIQHDLSTFLRVYQTMCILSNILTYPIRTASPAHHGTNFKFHSIVYQYSLQCFDTIRWVSGRALGLVLVWLSVWSEVTK